MFKRKKKSSSTNSETLKSLRDLIDGYVDYSDKKDRIVTDQVFRTHILKLITVLVDDQTRVHNQLMQAQILSAWQSSNMIIKELNAIKKFLRADVYRHSTFFEAKDVTPIIEISVFYILESETILTIESSQKLVKQIEDDLNNVKMETIEKNILTLQHNVNEITATIRDRAELIASYELVGF